jgi:hypothetical protein
MKKRNKAKAPAAKKAGKGTVEPIAFKTIDDVKKRAAQFFKDDPAEDDVRCEKELVPVVGRDGDVIICWSFLADDGYGGKRDFRLYAIGYVTKRGNAFQIGLLYPNVTEAMKHAREIAAKPGMLGFKERAPEKKTAKASGAGTKESKAKVKKAKRKK